MQDTPSSVMSYEQIMGLFQKIAEDREKWEQRQREEQQKWEKRQQEWEQQRRESLEKSDKEWAEIKRQSKATDKKIAELGDRIGQLVESMVEGGVVRKFRKLKYTFTQCGRSVEFENKALKISGEIDLFLENGEFALLVEVKTKLSIDDVKEHTERLNKYRQCADARKDKRKFIAAVGGGVVQKQVKDYALKNGMYVITQSGDTVRIASPPKGVKVKIW
ncbi:MAG: hypothetical protein LBT46_10825 [Planctomycetaceae bacterium]|jgi:hypothetical protein|nr:hypothetical protein [Planctomycetaceae bacterium]